MKRFLFYITALSLLATSCVREEMPAASSDREVEIGVRMLVEPQANIATRANTPENTIDNMFVLIFNADGSLGQMKYYTDFDALRKFRFKSGVYSLYVVANVGNDNSAIANDEGMFAPLLAAGTDALSQFKTMAIQQQGNSVSRTNPLVMCSDQTTLTVKSKAETYNVYLKRLSSRIDLKIYVKDTGHDLTLTSWQMMDCASRVYLVERTAGAGYTASDNDACVGNDAYYFDSEVFRIPEMASSAGKPGYKEYTTTFYLIENRCGENTAVTTEKGRGAGASAVRTKASKLVLTGMTPTRKITYTLYMGKNNTTDYNFDRNCIYDMAVVIDGINSISSDTRVTATVQGVIITPGASISHLDAHPSRQPLYLSASQGVAKVEVVDGGGQAVEPASSWLTLFNPDAATQVTGSGTMLWVTYPATGTSNTVLTYALGLDVKENITLSADGKNYLPRTYTLRITHDPDATSPQDFGSGATMPVTQDVTQQGPVYIGTFGSYNASEQRYTAGLIMERYEEYEMEIYTGDPTRVGMPWWGPGATSLTGLDNYNGSTNTSAIVGATNDSSNAGISGAFDPRVNTFAARYCTAKGPGWYLPAPRQLWAMIHYAAQRNDPADVAVKTGANHTYWASNMIDATHGVDVDNLAAISATASASNLNTVLKYVRCVKEVAVNTEASSNPSPVDDSNASDTVGPTIDFGALGGGGDDVGSKIQFVLTQSTPEAQVQNWNSAAKYCVAPARLMTPDEYRLVYSVNGALPEFWKMKGNDYFLKGRSNTGENGSIIRFDTSTGGSEIIILTQNAKGYARCVIDVK